MFGLLLQSEDADVVQVPSFTTATEYQFGSAYAGVSFQPDGRIFVYAGQNALVDSGRSWLLKGTATDYYLSRNVVSTFPISSLSNDAGSPVQLGSVERNYNIVNPVLNQQYEAIVEFSIGVESDGSDTLAEGIIVFRATRGLEEDINLQ